MVCSRFPAQRDARLSRFHCAHALSLCLFLYFSFSLALISLALYIDISLSQTHTLSVAYPVNVDILRACAIFVAPDVQKASNHGLSLVHTHSLALSLSHTHTHTLTHTHTHTHSHTHTLSLSAWTGWGRTGKAVACVKYRAVKPLSRSFSLALQIRRLFLRLLDVIRIPI